MVADKVVAAAVAITNVFASSRLLLSGIRLASPEKQVSMKASRRLLSISKSETL